MRAGMSFVRLGLAGLGKFVVLTSALSIAMFVAVTGPPTPSETAGVSAAVGHVVRRFDSAALHFTFDLCGRLPVAAHTAGVCGRAMPAVARAEPPARRIEVAAVSETVAPAAREVLPPDTIDRIARPPQHHIELLGEGPARAAHVRPTRANAARAHSADVAQHRPTRASAHAARRTARARPVRARPHRTAPPVHVVRAAPIAAPPRRPPIPVTPVAPAAHATASAPAAQGAPSRGSAEPVPDEHADAPPTSDDDKDTKS